MKTPPFVRSLACQCAWLGAGLAACLLLAACSLPLEPPAPVATAVPAPQQARDLAAQYAALRSGDGRVIALRPEASQLRIYVYRAGRAPALGHNHVLSAPAFEGFAYLPASGLAQARLDLQFRLDQLVFDLPAHRAEAGPAFAAVLPESAIAATREHMLGPDNMQAERYPFVRIHARGLHGEAPRLSARLAVEMHGQTREMDVPLNVSGLPQQLQVRGSLVLRQSDFGVQPYSVLGGLLAVQDEVLVEFSLSGE